VLFTSLGRAAEPVVAVGRAGATDTTKHRIADRARRRAQAAIWLVRTDTAVTGVLGASEPVVAIRIRAASFAAITPAAFGASPTRAESTAAV
jgi:hypothetical protein